MSVLRDARRKVAIVGLRRRLADGSNPAVDPTRTLDALRQADRVLFLCHGNICRSPLAERYLRRRLEATGGRDLAVDSAGFIEAEGRPSPLDAVTAARKHGVELSGHRSKRVTPSLVEAADVVVLMDATNYFHFDREFGAVDATVGFLGPLAGGTADVEIPDPYGGDAATFDRAYDRVCRAVDGLVAGLSRRSR